MRVRGVAGILVLPEQANAVGYVDSTACSACRNKSKSTVGPKASEEESKKAVRWAGKGVKYSNAENLVEIFGGRQRGPGELLQHPQGRPVPRLHLQVLPPQAVHLTDLHGAESGPLGGRQVPG